MWTFLGIASFTYVYKKCDVFLFWASRELVMASVGFLLVGAILTFYRYWGQKTAQILQLPLEILSILPFTNKIIQKSDIYQGNKAAKANIKVSYCDVHDVYCTFTRTTYLPTTQLFNKSYSS